MTQALEVSVIELLKNRNAPRYAMYSCEIFSPVTLKVRKVS